MRNLSTIKAQDILLLLKLVINSQLSQKKLSETLLISQAEISHGIQRLKASKLLNNHGKINPENIKEFLIHGLKYIFPIELGTMALGIPTAHSHPNFKFVKYTEKDLVVWPSAIGKTRGLVVQPIYETLPKACLNDSELYRLASLVEMLRIGRAREKTIAAKELTEILDTHI